jgi:hypothetical protein
MSLADHGVDAYSDEAGSLYGEQESGRHCPRDIRRWVGGRGQAGDWTATAG